jgi:hypothetical protein
MNDRTKVLLALARRKGKSARNIEARRVEPTKREATPVRRGIVHREPHGALLTWVWIGSRFCQRECVRKPFSHCLRT